jgi:hypothetical protein
VGSAFAEVSWCGMTRCSCALAAKDLKAKQSEIKRDLKYGGGEDGEKKIFGLNGV